MEQLEFSGSGTVFRPISTVTFNREVARKVLPDRFRSWRVKNTGTTNSDAHNISYEIVPESSQVFRGPSAEKWTLSDIYLTQNRTCEKWATHNPPDRAGGCSAGGNVRTFTNNEIINDLVVWYRVSFHHLPRDEDEPNMSAHWQGFDIVPRDLTATSPIN